MTLPDRPRLRQVVIDTTDARASAEFWRQLLDLVYRPGHAPPADGADDVVGREWLNLRTTDGEPVLAFEQVASLPRSTWPADGVHQQLHLDLTVRGLAGLEAAHVTVLELGGSLLQDRADDPDEPLRVYADLDGHPFCIFVGDD
ncbi:MAG: glyoxalase [Frankiales bacterium]|nr:glyoxalase [Frankiales bacterium]